jgi:hypothetical protein
MSRYRGPHLKKIRHLGALPGLTRKTPMKVNIHRRGHARPLLYILKVI